MNKRLLAGIAVAGIVGGGTYGFAATLGVSSDNLGAGSTVVASCDTDGITADYTAVYSASANAYQVTTVELGGVAATCDTQQVQITLSGAANASLNETVATVAQASGAQTITLSAPVAASAVTGLHVVISPN
jgi:hypothetical protein